MQRTDGMPQHTLTEAEAAELVRNGHLDHDQAALLLHPLVPPGSHLDVTTFTKES